VASRPKLKRPLALVVLTPLVLAGAIRANAGFGAHNAPRASTSPVVHETRDAQLRALLATAVARARAPGGVPLVKTRRSTWLRSIGAAKLARSYGHPKAGRRMPMPVRGRFRIASITKTYTAALVLQLTVDRTLSLDDTVERWLPGRLPNGAGTRITVRELIEHRSGLQDGLAVYPGTIVIAGPPGRFYYANANYTLLGEIVEAATHSAYAALLETRILHPLGLARTEVARGPITPPGLVHGYAPEPIGSLRVDETTAADSTPAPASGIVADATDVARFERALFSGKIVPADVVAEMQKPMPLDGFDGHGYTAYGLGLMRFPSRCGDAWGHRGHGIGYTAWMLSTRNGARTAVLLLNDGILSWKATMKVNPFVTRALCT
jgi:D-alanyl-D-alanine carboxypeptidase